MLIQKEDIRDPQKPSQLQLKFQAPGAIWPKLFSLAMLQVLARPGKISGGPSIRYVRQVLIVGLVK